MGTKISNVRLSFPQLFTPKEFTPGDSKPRFDATFLVEKGSDNDKIIRAAIAAAAKEAWGEKPVGSKNLPAYQVKLKALAGDSGKFCYVDGDTKEYDGYEGHMALTSHRGAAQGAPVLIDRLKNKLTASDGKPYAGCFVNASIEIWIQAGQYPGVRCTLIGVQFVADGDAFAGAQATDEDFDDLGDDEADISEFEDPLDEFGGDDDAF